MRRVFTDQTTFSLHVQAEYNDEWYKVYIYIYIDTQNFGGFTLLAAKTEFIFSNIFMFYLLGRTFLKSM